MSTLSDLRTRLKMSQEAFAEFCDISRVSVARYEAGAPMSRKNAQKISRACGISMDALLDEKPAETSIDSLKSEQEGKLSQEETKLISDYRAMTQYGRQRAQETLHELRIVYPEENTDSGD